MSKEIDHDEAMTLLRDTWAEVRKSDEKKYVDDYIINQGLKEILHADKYGTRTFKYILVTNVLAKAVNSDVHALALQDQSELNGSFNSGGLATDVVTDWEKDNGERLGGSNEPRTNSVYYRQSKLNKDYEVRNDDLYQTLIRVLSELQEQTEAGTLTPLNMLRQTLKIVSQLDPTTISYSNPPDVPCADLKDAVANYLKQSNVGERLAAVVAGIIDAQYFNAGRRDIELSVEHVNVADENSNAAGDIEVFETEDRERLLQAAEVKDKPATKSDIQHSITTARNHKLDEYLFITGRGFQSPSERRRAIENIKDADIDLVLMSKSDLLSGLKFCGREGRTHFRKSVGDYLNDMRAQEATKSDWKETINSLRTD